VKTSWQANAKKASQVPPPLFDLNQARGRCMSRHRMLKRTGTTNVSSAPVS
jgi:hypothetical protein